MNELEQIVLNAIREGRENKISSKELERLTGLKRRAIASIIERLIVEYSIPILASRDHLDYGYYIPANRDELLTGIKPFENQVKEMRKRVNALLENDLEQYKELKNGN